MLKVFSLFFVSFFFTLQTFAAKSQLPQLATNGTVKVMAQAKNYLFLGGSFSTIGQPAQNFLLLNNNGGLTPIPSISNNVEIIAALPADNGFYIGGFKNSPGKDYLTPYLALLSSDGSVEEYKVLDIESGYINNIIERNGILYLFGRYSDGIIPIEKSDILLTFNTHTKVISPPPFQATGWLSSWAMDGDDLYVSSSQLVINEQKIPALAVHHLTTGVTEDLSEIAGMNASLFGLEIHNGKLYAYGAHLNLYGKEVGLVEIDLATRKVSDWSPANSAEVQSAKVFDSKLVILSFIDQYDGKPLQNITAYDLNSHEEIPLVSNLAELPRQGFPYGLHKQDQHLFITGYFGDFIPVLDIDMSNGIFKSVAEDLRPSGIANTVVRNSSQTLLAGRYSSLYSYYSGPLAVYDLDKNQIVKWNSNIPLYDGGGIHAMEISEDGKRLYFSGFFDYVLGERRSFSNAAINTSTLELLDWEVRLGDQYEVINTFANRNGKLLIGGDFTLANGVTRNNFAEVDHVTAVLTDWNPSPTGPVFNIKYDSQSQLLWMSGNFKRIENKSRHGFAGYDGNGKLLFNTWSFDLEQTGAYDFISANDVIYAFGSQFSVDDVPVNKILKLTIANKNIENFASDLPTSPYTLLPDGNQLYAVGYYFDQNHNIKALSKKVDASTGVGEDWHLDLFKDTAPYSLIKLNDERGFAIGGWAPSGGFFSIVKD